MLNQILYKINLTTYTFIFCLFLKRTYIIEKPTIGNGQTVTVVDIDPCVDDQNDSGNSDEERTLSTQSGGNISASDLSLSISSLLLPQTISKE